MIKKLYRLAGASFILAILAASLASLVGCAPRAVELAPEATSTPLPPTATPTPTIVWFPPTATPTPNPNLVSTPVLTPTADRQPIYGDLLFQEDFSTAEAWTVGRTAAGVVALGQDELSLAVSQPKGYIFSLYRRAQLTDYYLEITVNPSICRGEDEYGLLVRVSPNLDFFRFSLTCNGQVRVDRYLNGRASSPVPLQFNSAVPPGAPSLSRLAVAARGNIQDYYVNGIFIASVRDASLPSGTIGVFTRAAGEDAVSVNFSDLQVYQLP